MSETVPTELLEPFALSPKQTAKAENCGLSVVYERLAKGEYTAVKDGTRTKVLYASIKQRRASLPKARYAPFRPRPNSLRQRREASQRA